MSHTWQVVLSSYISQRVEADLLQIADGCLVFKNLDEKRRIARIVLAFTRDAWLTVSEVAE